MNVEYIIVTTESDKIAHLQDAVNEKLKEGYVLQGGVSMSFVGGRNWIDARPIQAMVKNNDK